MTTATPFDRIAANYDELWTSSDSGRAQRDAVWRVIDALFQPGDEILDLGCGTGEDAVHLGRRGIHVSAIDASSAMVEVASARGVAATQLSIENLSRIQATYDGVLSDFGALNCISDLTAVAGELARIVRPGGYVAICLLNRNCVWEMLWFGLHFRWRSAFRRLGRGGARSTLGVRVYYPSARRVRRTFDTSFEFVNSTGIGLFVPPSYVNLSSPTVHLAGRIDAKLGSQPVLRGLGDHRLYVFRRRSP